MTSHPNSLSKARRREALSGYLFLLPSFLGFAIFVIFPILYGIYLSFTNGDGFNTPQWIGLDNYKRLFQDDLVIKSLFNNFTYTLLYVPANLVLSLLVAVLLHSKIKGGKVLKTILFFPYITSSIAITTMWKQMLMPNGPVNTFLRNIGITNLPIPRFIQSSSSRCGPGLGSTWWCFWQDFKVSPLICMKPPGWTALPAGSCSAALRFLCFLPPHFSFLQWVSSAPLRCSILSFS